MSNKKEHCIITSNEKINAYARLFISFFYFFTQIIDIIDIIDIIQILYRLQIIDYTSFFNYPRHTRPRHTRPLRVPLLPHLATA